MCYSMYQKRSGAMKEGIGRKADAADKAATPAVDATARESSEGKSYSGFMGRLQSWIEKDDKKREESVG